MSDSRVTITLGRSGQVVTRETKHSRTDRFAHDFSSSKRYRGDSDTRSSGLHGVNGPKIAKNDLRFKLMRKRQSKQQIVTRDERTLNTARPPGNSYAMPRGEVSGSGVRMGVSGRELGSDLQRVGNVGKYYSSPQGFGGSRARSPQRILTCSGRATPVGNYTEVRQVPSSSRLSADVYGGSRFLSNDGLGGSRMMAPPPVAVKTASPTGQMVPRAAPPSAAVLTVPFTAGEPVTVPNFLHSLGLGKYAVLFQAEEIDMTVLKQMGDKDLKDMGIPMGPRKKILLALLPHQKRPTSLLLQR